MAEHSAPTYSNKPLTVKQREKDFVENERTYVLFLKLAKWGTIAVSVLLIILYFWLVH